MKINVKSKIELLHTHVLCLSLFVKNLFLTKKLVVKSFLYTNKIIVRGNHTQLSWEITGCHKILIKDLGLLPGNVSHTSLALNSMINLVEITFYGVGGQKEVKKIQIGTTSLKVLISFRPAISISYPISTTLVKKKFSKELADFREKKQIILQKQKILLQSSKIDFEPFIKSKYLIKS